MRLYVLILYSIVMMAVGSAFAQNEVRGPLSPQAQYIQALFDSTLANFKAQPENRRRLMEDIMQRHLKINETSKFVAGRLWRLSSEPERTDFIHAFTAFLVKSSVQGLANHPELTLSIEKTKPEINGITEVISAVSLPDGTQFPVSWLVQQEVEGEFYIEDIRFLGISFKNLLRDYVALSVTEAGNSLKKYADHLSEAEAMDFGSY